MPQTLLWPMPAEEWGTGPISLEENDVHIWAWSWSEATPEDFKRARSLSPVEIATMEQLQLPEDRIRYACCHANLRLLLARYLHLHPRDLQFETGSYGKPRLCPSHGDSGLHFSLSYTRTAALLAMGRRIDVGVDLEEVRSTPPRGPETYFSPREREELERLQGEEWTLGFYHGWTRKEAILKAEGFGLTARLDSFSVTLAPGSEARFIEREPGSQLTADWMLLDLKPGPDLVASLATRTIPRSVRYFVCPPGDDSTIGHFSSPDVCHCGVSPRT